MVQSGDGSALPGLIVSRRHFLELAAALGGGTGVRPGGGGGAPPPDGNRVDHRAARVVQNRNPQVVDGPRVHRHLLAEMLEGTLTALTGTHSADRAWQCLLRPEDIVGLKFNQSGQQLIGTSTAMAEVLVGSLASAGWGTGQIVCIEAPPRIQRRLGTLLARGGYSRKTVDFGSGSDHLAAVLSQVTALINLPYVKTHNIAGMTCGLKNLSHGLIKHPAQYHGNACSPYIGDIVALPAIRGKLRLTLVDALRVVYDGGPEPAAGTIADCGTLIASTDPLAAEVISLILLNDVRRQRNLEVVARSAGEVGYLAAASRNGLGVCSPERIELIGPAGTGPNGGQAWPAPVQAGP